MISRTRENSSSNRPGRDIIPSLSSKLFRHSRLDIGLIDYAMVENFTHVKRGIVKYGKMTDEPATEVNDLLVKCRYVEITKKKFAKLSLCLWTS